MNSLNSVLLEGKVTSDPIVKDGVMFFLVESERLMKDEEGNMHDLSVTVEIHCEKGQAELCTKAQLHKGRRVRVVGRLELVEDTGVRIFAEHVEIRQNSHEG